MFKIIKAATAKYSMDPDLLAAMCWRESNHKSDAHNPDDPGEGAWGLCQLLPPTASWMAGKKITSKELRNPELNAALAAKYLNWQLLRYKWNVKNAILAYNTGSVKRFKTGKRKGQIINLKYFNQVICMWLKKPWKNPEAVTCYDIK